MKKLNDYYQECSKEWGQQAGHIAVSRMLNDLAVKIEKLEEKISLLKL